MTTFGTLKYEDTGETRNGLEVFELTEDFHAIDEVHGEIVVKSGYKTDFASIPWGFRWIFPVRGKMEMPAVLHDWVNARGVTEITKEQRRWSTGIFNRAMKTVGITTWKRLIIIGYVWVFTFPDHYLP